MPNTDEGFEMDESDSLMKPRRYRPYGQSRISYWCSQLWENCCDRYVLFLLSLNASLAEIKCHLMLPFLKDFLNSLFSSALSMLSFS